MAAFVASGNRYVEGSRLRLAQVSGLHCWLLVPAATLTSAGACCIAALCAVAIGGTEAAGRR